ncbi:MAG: asparagine synthetase B family protein [bacterium]
MSGIFGLIIKDSKDKDLIYKMSIPYGDPSSISYFFEKQAVLAAKRKPFSTGRQDEYGCSPDKDIHLIISGEIINRQEIINWKREKLTQKSTDAEIAACLFEEYGSECIKKMSGQFCIAVWQAKIRRLHLLLDRVGGLHNLYYTLTERGFIFGSRMHSLIGIPGIKKEINTNSMVNFFATGYILPPESLIKNIYKLRPGEEVIYEKGIMRSRILDRIEFFSNGKKDISKEEFCIKLINSIKNLSNEREAAFLLSGGIDSSILVALASQNLARKIKTFTASFPGHEIDESKYARIIAKTCDCENETIELQGNCFMDALPEIIWNLDEPALDFSVIPVYHLFKHIKNKTSIIISGDGPDHILGRYYPLAAKRFIANKNKFFRLLLGKIPVTFMNKIARAGNGTLQDAYKEIYMIPNWGTKNADTILNFLSKDFTNQINGNMYFFDMPIPDEDSFEAIFEVLSFIDFYIDGSFGVFSKIGKMAAAHDMIVREPYLEKEVTDFMSNLPLRSKVRGNALELLLSKAKEKYFLRYELGPGILPLEIINKRKGGFVPPLKSWLKETGVCNLPPERLLCPTVLGNGYFNPSYLKRIFSEHLSGIRDWSIVIFAILSFDLWVRMIIENDYKTFPGWKLKEVYR